MKITGRREEKRNDGTNTDAERGLAGAMGHQNQTPQRRRTLWGGRLMNGSARKMYLLDA